MKIQIFLIILSLIHLSSQSSVGCKCAEYLIQGDCELANCLWSGDKCSFPECSAKSQSNCTKTVSSIETLLEGSCYIDVDSNECVKYPGCKGVSFGSAATEDDYRIRCQEYYCDYESGKKCMSPTLNRDACNTKSEQHNCDVYQYYSDETSLKLCYWENDQCNDLDPIGCKDAKTVKACQRLGFECSWVNEKCLAVQCEYLPEDRCQSIIIIYISKAPEIQFCKFENNQCMNTTKSAQTEETCVKESLYTHFWNETICQPCEQFNCKTKYSNLITIKQPPIQIKQKMPQELQ